MAAQYASADLVICRAGATTVAEITALGKASVLIPYPYAADDHQTWNARRLVAAGAAEMIAEEQLSGAFLSERIRFFASHPAAVSRLAMQAAQLGKPDAAQRIVDECCRLLGRRVGRKTAGR
jgi:UDP-N-acetylglucosamine--N-acetylmuramyl-(pentapeptide) pyrophosphoryl-undecaprenol N-acetylglucosamine transferase